MKKITKNKAVGGVAVIAPRVVPVARIAPAAVVASRVVKKGGAVKSKGCK
jgi:hypothetical protein